MEILVQVKHNHHQVIPTFECKSMDWEVANSQFGRGLEHIHAKNQFYIDRFESYNALICGIIDFVLIDEQGTRKGQFGFSVNNINGSIMEMVEWYLEHEHSVENIG